MNLIEAKADEISRKDSVGDKILDEVMSLGIRKGLVTALEVIQTELNPVEFKRIADKILAVKKGPGDVDDFND